MMNFPTFSFWGKTKYWWVLTLVGILLIPCGFWIWFQPYLAYEAIAMMLGWFLVATGIVQLLVCGSVGRKSKGWGWWLAGGIIDLFIGFLLVGNLSVTEMLLPYFFALAFLYKGVGNLISAFSMMSRNKYWWLYLINGILLFVISMLFIIAPFTAAYSIVLLCAVVFIYWGFSIIFFSYDLKPGTDDDDENPSLPDPG